MNKQELIESALRLPPSAISYYVSQNLALLYPDKVLVESDDQLFDIEEYERDEQCSIMQKIEVYNEFVTNWEGADEEDPEEEARLVKSAKNAWLEVGWRGYQLEVIRLEWVARSSITHYWILANDEDMANSFFEAVCKWNAEVRGEILVFDDGCWQKDRQLFHAIKNATFDNLVLQGNLKQTISEDITSFFTARDLYKTYNLPWKRGLLFVGPPGNGKTHAVKALINLLEKPCLYVKSFTAEYSSDAENISKVFAKARKTAPCILVLEDLDSLLTPENRAFFLNELDGFAANAGIVTLATTNHPERLDPAILDRPSRFDRKYPFDLPGYPERIEYIMLWNTSLHSLMRLPTEAITQIATLTNGFSFAYLKELFLSSMMRWIAAPQADIMDKLMVEQVEVLSSQMMSKRTLPEHESTN